MRTFWGILTVGLLAAAASAAPAHAATVAEELTALAGEWTGAEIAAVGHPGGVFHLAIAPTAPGGALVATGRLGADDDGSALLLAGPVEIVQSGGQCFALTGGNGVPEGAFAVEHAPFGGLRFHRLVRAGSEDQLAVQAEELVLAKAGADGTRRLKVTRGERLCRDAAGAESLCGTAQSRTYSLKR